MQTIMANARGFSVLAQVHMDRVLSLIAVAAAMALGGWLCMAALAIP